MPFEKSAVLAGLPLFFGGIGCFVGGWLARRLALGGMRVAAARRWVAGVGIASAGLLLLVVPTVQNATLAIVVLGMASFGNDLSMASAWGACMDVGGRNAGSLSGSMNMMGNLGGAVGPVVVGYILDHGRPAVGALPSLESWTTAFMVAAAIYGVGALAWIFLDPVTPMDSDKAR